MSPFLCIPQQWWRRSAGNLPSHVKLNVGGKLFQTTPSTLLAGETNFFSELLRDPPGPGGEYFIDRDSDRFRLVLNFLRDGPETLPTSLSSIQGLRHEAKFFKLPALAAALDELEADAFAQARASTATSNMSSCSSVVSEDSDHRVPCSRSPRLISLAQRDRGAPIGLQAARSNVSSASGSCRTSPRAGYLHNSLHASYESTGGEAAQRGLPYDRGDSLDTITRTIAGVLAVPVSVVSLMGDSPSSDAIQNLCVYMRQSENPKHQSLFVIEDLLKDPRLVDSPVVQDTLGIRFFAGCPIVAQDGLRCGLLCVLDYRPRRLSRSDCDMLESFASIAAAEIERNSRTWERSSRPPSTLRPQEAACDPVIEAVLLVWATCDSSEWPIIYANSMWTDLTGLRVVPPSRLPESAQIEGDLRGLRGISRSSLWNWITLSEGCTAVWNLQKHVRVVVQDLSIANQPQHWKATGELRHTSKRINCRFIPSSMFWDANTASVFDADSQSLGCDDRMAAWGPGCFMFVRLTSKHVVEAKLALKGKASSALTNSTKTPQPNSCPSTVNRHVLSNCSMDSCGSSAWNRQTSFNFIPPPPPKSPFEGVHLVRKLSQGSFGKVYYGAWGGAPVAVKIVESKITDRKKQSRTFSPEFEAAVSSSLSHPHLVQTFMSATRCKTAEDEDETEEGGAQASVRETWIVQEWCDAGTLTAWCQQEGQRIRSRGDSLFGVADVGQATQVLYEIAAAGCYLHGRSIIHGDLTPNNVLLRTTACAKNFVCKVCDFGMARVLPAAHQSIWTKSMGTVTHMPPELFGLSDSGLSLTQKADVYSFGIILWQVLCKERPFANLSPPQIVIKVVKGVRPRLPQDVPAELYLIYQACINAERSSRPEFESVLPRIVSAQRSMAPESGAP